MSEQFRELFTASQQAVSQQPEQASVRFAVASRGHDGLHRQVSIRNFTVDVDEPPSLGGNDRAANPVEYALAALATCQEITYRLHAAALGIPLNDVSVQLEGDLDLRGFFGVDASVRPGFTAIRGSVQFDSPASAEELRRLKDVVDAHCPVLDLFRNLTPVAIAIQE